MIAASVLAMASLVWDIAGLLERKGSLPPPAIAFEDCSHCADLFGAPAGASSICMRRLLTLGLCYSSLSAVEDCRPYVTHWQGTGSMCRRLTFSKYPGIVVVLGDSLGGLLQRN